MIRVLQMIGSLNVGGSQTMLLNIYRNIDREKIQFDFVIDHPDHLYFAEEVRSLGGMIYTMPGFNGHNASEIKTAWDKFFTEHPEYKVLHSHVRSYASLYLPVAKRHGVKTIIHSHNTSNGGGLSSAVKRVMQYPLRNQADVLMACSREAGEWLFGKTACKKENFFFIPNAVDLDRFCPDEALRTEYREKMGLSDKLVIGHVGRMNEPKNHAFLLTLFAELLKTRPDARLFLVGDGPLREGLEVQAAELGITDFVIMTGNRNDVPALLQAMDIFAFPSLYEGLPVTLVEAQSAGLPCIISDRISTDVDVSSLITRLPIDSAERWAQELARPHERRNVTEEIIRSGFDIRGSVKTVSEIYINLAGECADE